MKNILFVASEAVPFVKTGGLGDVIGALPKEISSLEYSVKVILPFYHSIKEGNYNINTLPIESNVEVNHQIYPYQFLSFKDKINSIEYIFVRNEFLFDRDGLYTDPETNQDYKDNDDRFIFFARAILDGLKDFSWRADIIHVNDWQTGLIPTFLKTEYKDDPFYENIKTVLTIHNLAYQGNFNNRAFTKLNLPKNLFFPTSPFEFYGKVNFLKAAIYYSDKITTVSPNYAKEIQTEKYGCGLDGVLKTREKDILGILNGVDYKIWSPSRDKKIPHNYIPENLSGKQMNKVDLLNYAGLPVRDRTPLIGIISRLADQKGFDLVAQIVDKLFELDIQMIVLGTGDKKYHDLFSKAEKKYPDKCKVYLKFDDKLAHFIEAGSDIFLMPSKYEPCGLNQMYSLKYGTVPIVHKVGGLADTVTDLNESGDKGTGFVFDKYDSDILFETIERAVSYYKRQRLWIKIMKRGMSLDFSWKQSALKYQKIYNQLI
jgi:starch synthase